MSLHQTSMSCKQAQGGTWTCTCSAVVCSRPEMKQFKHGLPSPIGFQTNTKRRRDRGRKHAVSGRPAAPNRKQPG